MADTVLDVAQFRIDFPEYADDVMYPDSLLNRQFTIGKCFVADNDCTLPESCRAVALDSMLAHLLYIKDMQSNGAASQVVTSASEGDVSVSLSEPPSADNFQYWLNLSPYGKEVLAMLTRAAVGGFIVNGREPMLISGGF